MARSSLTRLRSFVEDFSGHEFWVGVDVHKRSYHVALYRVDGEAHVFVCSAKTSLLLQQLQALNISIAGLVYEAGPTGFTLARAAKEVGITVSVVAPSRVPRPVQLGAKTDRLDCIKLAEFGAKGMLKTIAVPSESEEARRSMVRRRHKLVDLQRKCKQRIKGQLLFMGIAEPVEVKNWTKRAEEVLLSLPMEESARMGFESLFRELSFLQKEVKVVDGQLLELLQGHHTGSLVEHLKTVPGVGTVVASTFCLEIFSPGRFARAEEVASYLGLAPMVRHSGERTPAGKLRPVGQRRLRSLLVESAWQWRARDEGARRMYNRLLSKVGIPQKAITALARKLAVILWRLCIEERSYRSNPAA